MKRRIPFLAVAFLATALVGTADAASRRSREKVEPPPPPPQFRVDGPTRKMELARVASNLAAGSDIGKFSRGCALLDAYGGAPIILHPEDAFRNARPQDFINIFTAEADAAGYALPDTAQGSLFEEQNTTRAEISVGAAVTDLKVNGCFGAVLIVKLAEVEATITIDWQVFDPLQKKLLYRTTNTGYAKLQPNEYNDTIVVEGTRAAFRAAAKNILADPNFVAALRDPRAAAAPIAQGPATVSGFQIANVPLSTTDFRQQVSNLRQQVVTVITPGGTGSGFYIADGLLLTNQHVIAGYSDVKIRFFGGHEVPGFVISSNAKRDVALVKTDSQSVRGLPLRLERPPETSPVYVIGSPRGQEREGTITAGIVSAFRDTDEGPLIQSDVAITFGNSGGPMFDDKGNVAGISVSIYAPEGVQMGLNYFIPIADALKTLNIDPSQPPGSAPALVSLPGAAVAAPASRDINVAMFPAAGPIRQGGQASPLAGTVSGVGTSGTFTFTRPDSVNCTGRWTTLQNKPQSGSLMDKHREVLGMSQSADGMVGGLAIGACSNNASFEAEYYVTPGVDSGFGAASDSDGNVYKIIF